MKTIKKIVKWIGYVFLGIVLIALSVYVYAYVATGQRLQKVYTTYIPAISIPTDSASIVRGAHLYVVHACKDCHGPDLRGRMMIDDPLFGRFVARNLTQGKGGLPADFGDEDWLRVLKHGVNREGKTLMIMPANETTKISDKELADIIAFCKSAAPVDTPLEQQQKLGPLARILMAFHAIEVLPAEQIDHAIQPIAEKQAEASAAYGQYLTTNCAACHGKNFQGGPSLAPGYPPVPNITSTGSVGQWSEEEFMRTLRTGITPEGHPLDSTKMPWPRTREFSDIELNAVRLFLMSLPQKQAMELK